MTAPSGLIPTPWWSPEQLGCERDCAIENFRHARFGTNNVVPTAVLSGVYKLKHLESAQVRGLALFWAHDLPTLIDWIERTRT